MNETRFNQYGKEVKKRLIDMDKTQTWLIGEVGADTGLFFDDSYLHKIMTGKSQNQKVICSINRILRIPEGTAAPQSAHQKPRPAAPELRRGHMPPA